MRLARGRAVMWDRRAAGFPVRTVSPCPAVLVLSTSQTHVVAEVAPVRGVLSGAVKVSAQAARSIGGSAGFWARVGQPSTLCIVIWPEASSAQNSMAAVSAEGRTAYAGASGS